MTSVFSTLLGPILVLWIGALVFYIVDHLLQPQDRGVAETLVLTLGLGLLVHAQARIDEPIYVGQYLADAGWRGMPPFLVAGRTSWALGLIALGGIWAASLASLGRRTPGRAGRLATLGAMLLFLFAGDWATLVLAWGLVDIALLYALGKSGERAKPLTWTGLLSLGGTIALGSALLLWQQAEGSTWVDRSGVLPIDVGAATVLPTYVAGLLTLAAVLRTMPFPLPMWQDVGAGEAPHQDRPVWRVMLSIVPTLLGTYLWVRLAQWGVVTQSGLWLAVLPIWGGIALLIGALKAWGAQSPKALIASTNVYGGGIILLGAGLGAPASWQLLVGVHGVLGVATLLMSWTHCQYLQVSNWRSYWRAAPAAVAILAMAGLPLTLGFPARVAVYGTIFGGQSWLPLLLVMLAEVLYLGALLRIVLDIESTQEGQDEEGAEETERQDGDARPGDLPPVAGGSDVERDRAWQREVGYGAGAALALGLIILGLAPGALSFDALLPDLRRWFGLPTLPVWAALLLPVVGAVVIYRYQDMLLGLAAEWWPLFDRLLRFNWVYQAIESVMRRVGALIWGTTRVVEGAGYMAWVVLACLVILFFVIAR